jgi:hypothetical protein
MKTAGLDNLHVDGGAVTILTRWPSFARPPGHSLGTEFC